MIVKNVTNSTDLKEIIDSFKISSDTVLIKPNWVGAYPGGYTDAKIIDLFLTVLKSKRVIFLESYTFWRTDKKQKGEGDYFSSKEATLMTGKKHWEFFKKMDDWFLKETGIGEVLKHHNTEYLCLTDEIWKGNIADSKTISELVEKKYRPVADKDLYEIIPAKLLELKGLPLISLAKAKIDSAYGLSASIKNMFGLIPDPTRYEKYHGGDPEKLLSQSIVDVNKIYQSLFDVHFVVESVFEYCRMNWDIGRSTRIDGEGTLIAGDSGYEVDSTAQEMYKTKMSGPLEGLLDKYHEELEKYSVPAKNI